MQKDSKGICNELVTKTKGLSYIVHSDTENTTLKYLIMHTIYTEEEKNTIFPTQRLYDLFQQIRPMGAVIQHTKVPAAHKLSWRAQPL